MASTKRADLVGTAISLFSRHGYHATGIDRIAAEANVSKRTLYKHFRTKEELILAALREHDGAFRNHFAKAVETSSDDPTERILAVFDVAKDWFCQQHFYGCMFINAVGEFSEADTAIRAACKEFKRLMRNHICELAADAGIEEAGQLADEISLLLEGAIVTAQVSNDNASADRAKRIARTLLRDAQLAR